MTNLPDDAPSVQASTTSADFDDIVIVQGPCGRGLFGPAEAPAKRRRAPSGRDQLAGWRPARGPDPRARRHSLAQATAAALLGLPVLAVAAGSCSGYKGQVMLNELFINKSGKSELTNRVELFNSVSVTPAVWQTWSIVVYDDTGKGSPSQYTYAMSAGFTANGQFIYNNNKAIVLGNNSKNASDVALLDANGDFIDYVAVTGKLQTVPACFGATTIVTAAGSGKENTGDISRVPDGGAWPATATAGSTNTIGVSNGGSSSVDHYQLSLPSTGITCTTSTVTVTACADVSSPCTNPSAAVSGQTATLAAAGGTLGSTSVTFSAGGVASTTLSWPAAGNGSSSTVTLSGETTAAANSRQCCPDGVGCAAANSCSITFSTAGFIVSSSAGGAVTMLPTQTAGTASGNYVLRAVKTGTTTQACVAALSGANTVNWGYQCNDPTTCSAGSRVTLTGTAPTAIAGNPNGSTASTTAVNMLFDANGNAPFSFSYADAGRITLHATKAAGGALLSPLSGSSNAFVVKPAGFVLSNIKCSSYSAGACATSAIASPGNNPAAASGSGTAFIPAGKAFSATVTAVDAGGSAVPNFGKETSPEGVTLAPTLVAPAGGTAGSLSNASGFGSFSGGAAAGTGFAYSEVGIITLRPSLTSGNYLGSGGAVTGTASGNVGRFIPDHFTTTLTHGCSGSFTYSGQPFAATLGAYNASGSLVANYGATGFAKAVVLSDAQALGTGSFTAGGSVAAGAFTAGVAAAAPVYTFTNKLTAPGTLTLRATDSDGVSSAGHAEGSTGLRSGRLRLANGFGRENAALQLVAQAEYWTGASWLLNGNDSCTTVPAAAVALGHYRNHLGASTAAWSSSASALTIASGSGVLTLAAPTPGATGSLALALNLGHGTADQSCTSGLPASTGAALPWLRALNGACAATADRDPAARASFGIYSPETRKTVHARELF